MSRGSAQRRQGADNPAADAEAIRRYRRRHEDAHLPDHPGVVGLDRQRLPRILAHPHGDAGRCGRTDAQRRPGLPRGSHDRHPEQLLLAAASSCQFLSFLAAAARAGVDVVDYTDDASAVMPEDVTPVRISEITLRPAITVRGADEASVVALVHTAHDECYVANSLATRISIEPTVRTTDG